MLLLQAEKEINTFLIKNCMFKLKINLDRHGPASYPNICLLPGPHCFSFPSTFKIIFLSPIEPAPGEHPVTLTSPRPFLHRGKEDQQLYEQLQEQSQLRRGHVLGAPVTTFQSWTAVSGLGRPAAALVEPSAE
jgi:hypothetical protein